MKDRHGMRKERGKSLPFQQEPTLERAEMLAAQYQSLALAKEGHQQPAALCLCSFSTPCYTL